MAKHVPVLVTPKALDAYPDLNIGAIEKFPDIETAPVIKLFPDIKVGDVLKLHRDEIGDPGEEGTGLGIVILPAHPGEPGVRIGKVVTDLDELRALADADPDALGVLKVTVLDPNDLPEDWALLVSVDDVTAADDD